MTIELTPPLPQNEKQLRQLWRVVWRPVVVVFLMGITFGVFTASTTLMASAYQWPAQLLGQVMMGWMVGGMIATIALVRYAHHALTPKTSASIFVIAAVIGTGLFILPNQPLLWFGMFCLHGMTSALLHHMIFFWIAERTEGHNIARGYALRTIGISTGNIVGANLIGLLGVGVVMCGVLYAACVGAAVIVWYSKIPQIEDHATLSLKQVKRVFKARPVLIIIAMLAGVYGETFYAMILRTGHNLSLQEAQRYILFTSLIGGGVVLNYGLSIWLDRLGASKAVLRMGIIAIMVGIGFYYIRLPIALYALAFVLGGFDAIFSSLRTYFPRLFFKGDDCSTALVLASGFQRLGALIGTITLGWCLDQFGVQSFGVFIIVLTVMLVLAVRPKVLALKFG